MFENIGYKIKTLAQVVAWIGIGGSVFFGLIIMCASDDGSAILPGLLLAGLGSFFSWIGSWSLYAFGQLVDNTDIIVKCLKRNEQPYIQQPKTVNRTISNEAFNVELGPKTTHQWRCNTCGNMVSGDHCEYCRENNPDVLKWRCNTCGNLVSGEKCPCCEE